MFVVAMRNLGLSLYFGGGVTTILIISRLVRLELPKQEFARIRDAVVDMSQLVRWIAVTLLLVPILARDASRGYFTALALLTLLAQVGDNLLRKRRESGWSGLRLAHNLTLLGVAAATAIAGVGLAVQ
jgi:hypothetical protein